MRKYSKVEILLKITRLLLSISTVLLIIILLRSNLEISILPVLLVFVGSFLLIRDRKRTDYISFFIFIFGFVISITYPIKYCLESNIESDNCFSKIYDYYIININFATIFIFLSGLILINLLISFCRRKSIE
jgi:hypothetical protein